MRNLAACSLGRMRWWWFGQTLPWKPLPRRLRLIQAGAAQTVHGYRFSGGRLHWECERSCRLLTNRGHCHTDDPVDGSRRARADQPDCDVGCGSRQRYRSLQGTSGSLSHSITTALTVSPVVPPASTNAALSGSSYGFGNNLVNNTVTQSVVTVTNTGTTSLTMNPTLSGDPSYALVSTGSCGAQLARLLPALLWSATNLRLLLLLPRKIPCLDLGFVGVPAGTSHTVALSGTSAALPVGQVTATNNPRWRSTR